LSSDCKPQEIAMPTSKLSGTTAVITGGADGIGLALGRALASRGVRVALLDIREEAARDAAKTIPDAIGFGCDISDAAATAAAAKEASGALGGINQLWVNAGVGIAGTISAAPQRGIDWVYAVNAQGSINTVRSFLPLVAATEGFRHIGFTASSNTLGRVPAGPLAVYAASKWATLGIAEAVAGEAGALGIGSTIFCPGLLNTRIWDGGRARPDRFGGAVHAPEETGEMWRQQGMSVDWACEEAIKAVEANQPYCAPVDQHSLDAFEERVAAVRSGFVIHPTQQAS
jgi:NAD(P)-dependent dehydrogenase (short-subunit alcohol dehydrogenase family)